MHKSGLTISRYYRISIFIISILFLFSALYKVLFFYQFEITLYNSRLIPELSIPFLQFFLPIVEFSIFNFLNFKKTIFQTLFISFFILCLYTTYLIFLNNMSLTDGCSCGGIFTSLSYSKHLIFNFIFISLNLFLLISKSSK